MNDKLNEAVTALITKTLDGVDASVAFMQEELPDYVVELMMWHSVSSGIQTAAWVLFPSILTFVVIFYIRKGLISGEGLPATIIPTILSWLVTIGIIANKADWFKIWIAPKVWLVEYAAGLIK